MGRNTRIDWADATWNPVTGCRHQCPYCYARKIANRFAGNIFDPAPEMCGERIDEGGRMILLDGPIRKANGQISPYPYGFMPTFHRYRLDEPQQWKKPKNIFVCSMADLFGDWVPDEVIREVFDACDRAPWHRYIFLTKNPQRLMNMAGSWLVSQNLGSFSNEEEYRRFLPLPRRGNWWYGSTVDNRKARYFAALGWNSFISIEPITEYMDTGIGSFGWQDWIIIGAETGNRKEKIIPQRKWVDNIVETAEITMTKIFMKESLRGMMGSEFRQEFPWKK